MIVTYQTGSGAGVVRHFARREDAIPFLRRLKCAATVWDAAHSRRIGGVERGRFDGRLKWVWWIE